MSVFPNNRFSISYGGDFCSLPKIRMKESLPSGDPLVAAKYQEFLQKRTFVLGVRFFFIKTKKKKTKHLVTVCSLESNDGKELGQRKAVRKG